MAKTQRLKQFIKNISCTGEESVSLTTRDNTIKLTPPLVPPKRTPLSSIPIPFPNADTVHPHNSLLGLPAELRLTIYDLLFPPQTTHDRLCAIQADESIQLPHTHVLLVCRQLYHECAPRMHRTLLVVPERLPTGHFCAFPFSMTRLGDAARSGALASLSVKDLVVREYMDVLQSSRIPTAEPIPLDVGTIFLNLCLCRGDLSDLRMSWGGNENAQLEWAWSFCEQARRCAEGVRSVQRVVVYVCGLTRTVRFNGLGEPGVGDIVEGVKEKLMLFQEGSRTDWVTGSFVTWREEVPEEDMVGRKKGEVTRYRLRYMTSDGSGTNEVIVEFYDSWTETRKGCVLA